MKKSSNLNAIDDDDDDDDDININRDYTLLSTEELSLQINKFKFMCLQNKLSTSNAFDIDMIGSFYSWLEKKKQNYNDDDKSFKDIADYLDASGQVYSYRIDKLGELADNLMEEFKGTIIPKILECTIKTENEENVENEENEEDDILKKRQKLMLTTNDKLQNESIEMTFVCDPINKNDILSFNIHELFQLYYPARFMLSLYSNNNLEKDLEIMNNEIKNDNKETYVLRYMKKKLKKKHLCPDYFDFVTDHDEFGNTNFLDGIEVRFDEDNHKFEKKKKKRNTRSFCNKNSKIVDHYKKLDSDSNYKNKTTFDELVDCVDNIDNDYSFFNANRLANWDGPKSWKCRSMAKALKGHNSKDNQIIPDDIDEYIKEEYVDNENDKLITNKLIKVEKVDCKWLCMKEIQDFMDDHIDSKETILPRVLEKWHPLNNICEVNADIIDFLYKFNSLKYLEIKPNCVLETVRIDEKEDMADQSIINYEKQLIYDMINYDPTHNYSLNPMFKESNQGIENVCDTNLSGNFDDNNMMDIDNKDDDDDDDSSEPKMDITELKREISVIIDEEYDEIKPICEFDSGLPLSKLLSKLNVLERKELSVPIVYVGLLHLANERGLKLVQENCTIGDIREILITKPTNKT